MSAACGVFDGCFGCRLYVCSMCLGLVGSYPVSTEVRPFFFPFWLWEEKNKESLELWSSVLPHVLFLVRWKIPCLAWRPRMVRITQVTACSPRTRPAVVGFHRYGTVMHHRYGSAPSGVMGSWTRCNHGMVVGFLLGTTNRLDSVYVYETGRFCFVACGCSRAARLSPLTETRVARPP